MPIAIPLAGLTVVATLIGGRDRAAPLGHAADAHRADRRRRRRRRPVRRAARGDRPGRRHRHGHRLVAVGFLGLLLRRAGAGPPPPRRRDRGPRPPPGRRSSAPLGLSVHSFIDGLGIGLAFGVDSTTGFLVFIAVISHDFADGLNTVSFVLGQSGDRQAGDEVAADRRDRPTARRDRRLLITDLRSDPRLRPLRLQRLLPLHRRHRPAARGPRPRLLGARGLTASGFALIFAITRIAGV